MFEIADECGFRKERLSGLLPYLNAMHERYDFAWEREWRVVGDLEFEPKDIVSVILPEDDQDEQRRFLKRGVPVISPGWTAEQIVAEFSRQARSARKHWVEKKNTELSKKRSRGKG